MSRRLPHSSAGPGRALAIANVRYWTSVAPLVRAQLRRWEDRAAAIDDPALRGLALTKLGDEGFNAEVAATLATLAPREQRASTVEAIVGLQVLYDYLDGLTERPAEDPLRSGRRLSVAFTDALGGTDAQDGDSLSAAGAPAGDAGDYFPQGAAGAGAGTGTDAGMGADAGTGASVYFPQGAVDDGGYLAELSRATRTALAGLPAWSAVSETARASAALCAEAQVRVHAAPRGGDAQLEQWACEHAAGTGLQWREFIAGAVSSVLTVHALIAAAANVRTTAAEAAAIDSAYLSISALSTMLDSVIDYEQDSISGAGWYAALYDSRMVPSDRVAAVVSDARRQVHTLPDAAHHMMTLVGVAAYYTSAPEARRGTAAPLARRVNGELRPLIGPTLAVMRVWREAKTLRQAGTLRGGFANKRRAEQPAGVSVDQQTAAINRGLSVDTVPR